MVRFVVVVAAIVAYSSFASGEAKGARKIAPGRNGFYRARTSSSIRADRPSAVNCTWSAFEQPLDHFNGGESKRTYQQRICSYDGYFDDESRSSSSRAPIFFYVGNEAPVEEYVNNTGLMWTLAPKFKALLVFAEHRYFGKSMPQLKGEPNCLSYCSSQQALADYAVYAQWLKKKYGDRPIITFGGSYGGMLSSWARMKYPSQFAGAIAASAPIFGFPDTNPPLDGAFRAITRAASAEGGAAKGCDDHFLAAWPLISAIGSDSKGRESLKDALGLCRAPKSLSEVGQIIDFYQGAWFNVAEGDYPFASTYISYAVGNVDIPLPPWPMRVACEKLTSSGLPVTISGSKKNVKFTVGVNNHDVVSVDWNRTSMISSDYSDALNFLSLGLKEAVGVWSNITKEKECYDPFLGDESIAKATSPLFPERISSDNVCTGSTIPGGVAAGWGVLVCNEGLNLVNYLVKGIGNDMYWPPNVERDFSREAVVAASATPCASQYAAEGLFGVPETLDAFAKWDTTYYGGLDGPRDSSNIIFSNGLLDPWSTAGVTYNVSDTVQAVVLPFGGHHLDLFFPDENDPKGAIAARKVEERAIESWVKGYAYV